MPLIAGLDRSTYRKVVAGFAALLILATAVIVANRIGSRYTVTAVFPKTPGLYAGNTVTVLGVPVGKVTSIEPRGNKVEVRMEVNSDVRLAANASALLLPQSVVTDRVVELTPVHVKGPQLRDGATIPLERTRIPVEFQDVIEAVNDLSRELGRVEKKSGAIDDFLDVAAANARGNGTRLRDTLAGVQAALAGFTANSGDTVTLLRQLSALTHAMAKSDTTIRSFSNSLTDATALLSGDGKNINAALRGLLDALRDVAGFVTAHRKELKAGLKGIAKTGKTFGQRAHELAELVDLLPLVMQNAARAVDTEHHAARVRVSLEQSALTGGVLKGLCLTFTDLPVCNGLSLARVGPDLGLTELLTGSTP